jgi:drug/metabolite transporter (DMT)-like permease
LLVLCTFAWGATFVVIKDALQDASPLLFNAVRMAIAAALLTVIFRRQLTQLSRGAARAGVIVGISIWIGYEFQTAGLLLTTASKSAFLTGLSSVLVPMILAIFWKRHVNRWTLAGVGIAFIGLYLMTVPANGAGGFSLATINRGDLLTIGCAIAFAFQIITVGGATQRYPFGQIVTIEIAACALLMILSVPIAEPRAFMHLTPRIYWALGITIVFCTVAAFIVQTWAQQFTPPSHTALIFALEPVFAGLTSYIVLRERLGYRAGLGAALILGGVLLSELLGTVQHPEAELKEETV